MSHTPKSDVSLHERIRNRREDRGMAAYALAEKVGVSPSYISLIERGSKVPAEEVAEAIARALDDDPDLYRAWARLAGSENLGSSLAGADRLRRISTDPALREQLVSGRNLDLERRDLSGRRVEADGSRTAKRPSKRQPRSAVPEMIEVPVLAEGTDPSAGHARQDARVLETLRIDRRLLPREAPVSPFAYRLSASAARRAAGLLRPGDLVVLTSRVSMTAPESIHAVRHRGRVVLSRLLLKHDSMLLLPSEGASDFEVVSVEGRKDAMSRVAGTVVLTVRSWS